MRDGATVVGHEWKLATPTGSAAGKTTDVKTIHFDTWLSRLDHRANRPCSATHYIVFGRWEGRGFKTGSMRKSNGVININFKQLFYSKNAPLLLKTVFRCL